MPWQDSNTVMCIDYGMSCFAVERDGLGSTEMPDHGGATREVKAGGGRERGRERRAS